MDRYFVAPLIAVLVGSAPALAADADAGREKAEACTSCHFADDFQGQTEEEILTLIRSAAGGGNHPPTFDGLSATDLANIAAYFARGE